MPGARDREMPMPAEGANHKKPRLTLNLGHTGGGGRGRIRTQVSLTAKPLLLTVELYSLCFLKSLHV